MAPRGASARYIDEIIALIAGGMTGAEACKAKPEYPNYRSLTEWAAKHGRMVDISAAWRGREKSDNARMKTNVKYTEDQWDAALELLAANPRKSIRRVMLKLDLDLPSRELIYNRKISDPAFAERLAEATAATRTVISRHTPSTPSPVYRSGLLRAAVMRNDLYRAAAKAVPRGAPHEVRDDIIGEIVLAVLEGDLALEDISTKGNNVGWRRLRNPVFDSLDAPVYRDDERMSRVDMLSTSEIIFY